MKDRSGKNLAMAVCLALSALLLPGDAWAANVFVDPANSGDPDEDGSCEHPYDSWDDFVLSAADDYYQRTGTTWLGNNSGGAEIQITVDGSPADWIVIGAYTQTAGPACEIMEPGAAITRPILQNNSAYDRMFAVNASFIRIQNLDIRDGWGIIVGSASGLTEDESNVIVEHCDVVATGTNIIGTDAAIRICQSNTYDVEDVTVRYCNIDVNCQADGDASNDGIGIGRFSHSDTCRNAHIHNNTIDSVDHAGIQLNSDHAVIENNHIKDTNGHISECLNNNTGDHNIWRYNFCDIANAAQLVGGDDNVFFANIIDTGGQDFAGYTAAGINVQPSNGYSADNNRIYNNIIYHVGDTMMCLSDTSIAGNTSTANNNRFVNNLCLEGGGANRACLGVRDNANVIDESTVEFSNNLCFDSGGDGWQFFGKCGQNYPTASSFNDGVNCIAMGNLEIDPGLKNPSAGELWPDDPSDAVVGAGQDLGPDFADLLDPDNTDLSASPPRAGTISQTDLYVGAFVLEGTATYTCDDLGGVDCCSSGQVCPGADMGQASDCSGVCCSVACDAPPLPPENLRVE